MRTRYVAEKETRKNTVITARVLSGKISSGPVIGGPTDRPDSFLAEVVVTGAFIPRHDNSR